MKIFSKIIAVVLFIFSCSHTWAWNYLDVPGTACRPRSQSTTAGLYYKYTGELQNTSDKNILVQCSFQLKDSELTENYSAYVFGSAIGDEYSFVYCKLYVANSYSGKWARTDEASSGAKKGEHYRIQMGIVNAIRDPQGEGINVASLQCKMEPNSTIHGIRLFTR